MGAGQEKGETRMKEGRGREEGIVIEAVRAYPSSFSQQTLHLCLRSCFADVVMMMRYADSSSRPRDTRTLQQQQGQRSHRHNMNSAYVKVASLESAYPFRSRVRCNLDSFSSNDELF